MNGPVTVVWRYRVGGESDAARKKPIPEGGLSGGAGGAPVFERPEGFEDKSHFTPEEAEEFVANFDAYIEDQVKSSEGESFVGVETGLEWGTALEPDRADTLVIETGNFRETNSLEGSGPRMKLIEKITMVAPDQLRYEFSEVDPDSFESDWTVLTFIHRTDKQLYEYACHEGNASMVGILRGARVQERLAEGTPGA